MKKNFFKRSMKVVLGVTLMASVLGGCNEIPVEIGNEAPTVTVAPMKEVVESTQEVEPTVAPTEEPEVTEIPLISPEPVITEEPEVTPAFSLTVVPTPTEAPVVTVEPTEEPEPTVQPTEQPTVQPPATTTPKPTATAKPKATATPKPTSKPKATATAVPKATATPKPTSGWGKWVNKNAKNYKLITEELGLPGEIDSKFINYDEQFGYYSVDFWTSFSENGCPKYNEVNKTLYTKTTAFAADAKRDINIASVLEDAYFTVITEHAENNDFSKNTVFRNQLEKGQELTAVAYYPEWNIYKVKFNETKEYFVFGGQVSEKKPSGLDVHEYLAMELEDGEYVVTGLVAGATQTDIIIPSEIDGIPVTKIADGAFDGNNKYRLKSVVLGDNITEIGKRAFYNTSVEIKNLPDSIKVIGEGAFCDATIKTNKLPSSLVSIGDNAFDSTEAKFSSLPQSVKEIGRLAFCFCTFDEVAVPKEMTKVPDYAFSQCKVKKLTLHDNITRIGNQAFDTLDLGENVNINLPKKLTFIGFNGIFGNYGGFTIEGKVPKYYSEIPEHYFELRGEVDIFVDSLVGGWEKKYGKLTDLEYTLLAFDWVTKNVEDSDAARPNRFTNSGQGENGWSVTPAGSALLGRYAFCQTYTAGMKAILDAVGVENYCADNPGHIWNIVVIDGVQYNLDATWDVFLSSDKEFVNTGCFASSSYPDWTLDKMKREHTYEGALDEESGLTWHLYTTANGKEFQLRNEDGSIYAATLLVDELAEMLINPNCNKSFPSDKIASAKARLGLK